ncbi:hypothetical protein [Novilysobacter arseniciresistens]|uniref:hypothetical protein n=1 Tax=Novilysobacter arseniciresistens TaxID=1385522 RepID=UPI0006925189|nr:hypothetical protein [Lysobacter arseniciresistens]
MNNHSGCATVATVVIANCLSLAVAGQVRAQAVSPNPRLDALQQQVDAQNQRLDELRDQLAAQEHNVAELQRALDMERLATTRARGTADGAGQGAPVAMDTAASATAALAASVAAQSAPGAQDDVEPDPHVPAATAVAQAGEPPDQPVGRAPEQDLRPPEVAQIFDQPGVLTPAGTFILEPSLQFGYSSSNRVALVGYTIIPAILIGLIDVRQVKTSTGTAALTGRMGIGNRFELEARVPYVYSSSDTVSREIFTGTAVENVFTSSGKGLGDIEATARMQLNRGGPDKPFYVGWLRYKSRTGKDPFEVVTDCVTRCVANATGTGLPLELPTGSGFASLQPGITWLYPSDPVVFFGSVSYLHNFKRDGVSRTVLTGAPPEFPQTATEPIGEVGGVPGYG